MFADSMFLGICRSYLQERISQRGINFERPFPSLVMRKIRGFGLTGLRIAEGVSVAESASGVRKRAQLADSARCEGQELLQDLSRYAAVSVLVVQAGEFAAWQGGGNTGGTHSRRRAGGDGMILLDLFCGRWGWSRAFARRGWRCIGVDLTKPPEIPERCEWIEQNILRFWVESEVIHYNDAQGFTHHIWADAIVASPPCEEFSVHGMKHFHPHPKYPENGIRLFNHTRNLCEAAGVPYVMENVRAAQQFVGNAQHHCGPFYLWGNAVPPLVNQGIKKMMRGNGTE